MNESKKQNVHRVPPAQKSSESGQAIVLMALMMIVLLAMVGLAIDGGGMFFKWRDLQNATDAAALAAAYQRCAMDVPTYDGIRDQGVKAAYDNGFDNNGVDNIVTVYWPPSSSAPAEVQGDNHYVEVQIWAEKPAYFIHVVYKEPLTLENSAIGFCVEKFDPTTVPAIMALGSDCANDLRVAFAGGEVYGGMFSNGNIQVPGSGQGFDVYDGANAVQGIDNPPGGNVSFPDGSNGSAAPRPNPMPHITVQKFAPGGTYWNMVPVTRRTWVTDPSNPAPGWNSGNGRWQPPGGTTLRGLYYVDGDVRVGTGVNWDTTEGVTIVATGTIDVTTGPGKDMKHYYPAGTTFPGIALFTDAGADQCAPSVMSYSGSNMIVTGVLLAPHGPCATSLSDATVYGAIVCYNQDLTGSNVYIEYTPELLPPISPKVSIAQ